MDMIKRDTERTEKIKPILESMKQRDKELKKSQLRQQLQKPLWMTDEKYEQALELKFLFDEKRDELQEREREIARNDDTQSILESSRLLREMGICRELGFELMMYLKEATNDRKKLADIVKEQKGSDWHKNWHQIVIEDIDKENLICAALSYEVLYGDADINDIKNAVLSL